jgi:toxin CptA
MHSAPSVNYPVGRSRYARRLLVSVWALGVGCVTLASLQAGGLDWRQAVLALSAIVAGAAAWTGMLQSAAPGELDFDGRHWSISGGSTPLRTARASVALDLQSLILVRLDEPTRPRRWVWVDRQAMPARWRDLRRALHSRVLPSDAGTHAATVHHPGV